MVMTELQWSINYHRVS